MDTSKPLFSCARMTLCTRATSNLALERLQSLFDRNVREMTAVLDLFVFVSRVR